MNSISIHNLAPQTCTILPNWFVDHYLPRANGEFVKVYICLLRFAADPGGFFGLAQMADRLQCTEGDILRALLYWSRERLVSLEYNAEKELTGVCLTDPADHAPANTPSVSSFAAQDPAESAQPSEAIHRSSVTSDRKKEPLAEPTDRGRQTLTPDRVKKLKESEDVQQLLFISEQYLGKPLTPSEVQRILFFYDELHMSLDLIDYLIQHCVGKGHKSLRYIETVALAWAEKGVTTVEMAKKETSRYKKEYFTILKALGISGRNPVDTEIALMDTWLGQYGFSMELIQEACSRTVMQTGQPNFQYANGILSDWQKKGAHSLEDVKALDTQHQKRRLDRRNGRTGAAKTPNRFNNFQQRNYDFTEFEKKLLNQ